MKRTETPALLYLTRAEVIEAAAAVDPVGVIRKALTLHATGSTTLPDEAYLPWHTVDGRFARSLALPGALWGDLPVIGMKMINSSLANPDRGLPRAQGLTMLFDRETAYPVAMMEAAYLSALRTSAYTVLSVQELGAPAVEQVAVIGCGPLGAAHVRLLAPRFAQARFVAFDLSRERRENFAAELAAEGVAECVPVDSAEVAVRGSDLVLTTTTTTVGYIPHDWLKKGTVLAHVSLDDVLPDVVQRCDLLIVDDWRLIRADDRRLLGRMFRSGELIGPHGDAFKDESRGTSRRVDASLADVIAGRHPGRTSADQIVLSNPFGMGILDVALAGAVLAAAERLGLGTVLPG